MLPVLARFLRRNEIAVVVPSLMFMGDRLQFGSEDKMFVPISIVLASQLVIAVADDVPKFDIARGCKIDSAAAFDPNSGMSGTIKRCMEDEQKAKDQLQTGWSGFAGSDRTMCVASSTNDSSTPPSYVDLLTCLEDQQLARKLPKGIIQKRSAAAIAERSDVAILP
jgi:hypothetical protein